MWQPGKESGWSQEKRGGARSEARPGSVGLADFVRRMSLLANAVRRCPEVV